MSAGSRIRAVAVAVIRRDDAILVSAVPDEHKHVTGWRPPGGGIEFGERGEQTVAREIREELGVEITGTRYIATLENIFTFLGAPGHEIVQVYEARFVDPRLYERERIEANEEGSGPFVCVWRRRESFGGDAPLYPEGLLELLSQ